MAFQPPWLLVDVDGVLSPYLHAEEAQRRGLARHAVYHDEDAATYPLNLNPEHAQWLLDLQEQGLFRLAWATWWKESANTQIAPLIGMPSLPSIPLPTRRPGLTKGPGILELVGTDPFIWIDDDMSDGVRDYLADRHVNHLIIQPDHQIGLTRKHLNFALDWAARHAS